MTTIAAPRTTTTSTSPTGRDLWRAGRAPLLVALIIGLVAIGLALASPGGKQGLLDPDGVDTNGSHALATLLRDHGVDVTRVTSVAAASALAGDDATVLVTLPILLPPEQLGALADTAADLVLLAPDEANLGALHVPISVVDSTTVEDRDPGCGLRAATLAGSAEVGGLLYGVQDPDTVQCYSGGGAPALVQTVVDGRTITVLGTSRTMTNGRLAHSGNAALAMNLLGARPKLIWLVPTLGETVAAGTSHKSLIDLLPDRLLLVVGQLAIAVLVLALWRARRLGPVVAEPLPVVVRAAETVEGRARLYQAAAARDRAADALRIGCRSRFTTALGLPADAEPGTLIELVAARTGRAPSAVQNLLYGAAPDGDPALVRLADDLDALAREVRRP